MFIPNRYQEIKIKSSEQLANVLEALGNVGDKYFYIHHLGGGLVLYVIMGNNFNELEDDK